MSSSPTLSPPVILSFAGSDPSSGAGIQADLLTIAALGCHPLSVITAITVQDTAGVEAIYVLDSEWVADQARALLEDMSVAVFKIGMLGSIENLAAIAEIVSDYPDVPLILDPVLASGRGDEMAGEEIILAIKELLLPQTTVLTPNSVEARRLAMFEHDEEDDAGSSPAADFDTEDEDDPDLDECARRLVELGAEYVLITGTHENTPKVVNTLYGENGKIVRADTWARLPGSYHGSGCTLASAIAASIANGLDVAEAVREAQEYTWNTLAAAFRPGMGQHIPDRFFWARAGADDDGKK